ncbi:hypothetical protein BCD67_04140 [Oscillatoriales cyanobacterium USR001]|nr:hypothetical protein BCD67_04140 [Oscillatoriales cyanobacterium USR001]
MDSGTDFELGNLQSELKSLSQEVLALAESYQGDSLRLLALLRTLESLHREVREGLFQASLPDNRQALYKLLRNIESNGGWPYIQRMKLQAFLEGGDRRSSLEKSPDGSEQNYTQTLPDTENSTATGKVD